ncbi:DUF1302 domain-containing protein [Pseudomonas daroniae]|uniref:DUF1302 domain-containing protein n=1 Tax=Phytopseudomonas daroniae TaxID=2487519 RepID=A0A4V2KB28_9GAMM|nr:MULTISPECIES: DUF1302 domain-containing protein [Pseudomonas]TBU82094.1 DUF1302 domain-containing protein [Pseudomonas daroniae]TBU84570.1 DUF1302 domain-containing protein [Pseudomonas sp. FRB 228]TBU92395.1 DUF1302 domain-containing protein [Pseudomonas daroniae]
MRIKSFEPALRLMPAKAGYALASVLPLLVAVPVQAVEFSFADNEISGSLDTTLSYGQLWRVQGQSKNNDDVNVNDGNRNFDTGLVSEVLKITSDLEMNYQNYGFFVRGTAFYDMQIMDRRNDFNSGDRPAQPSQNFPRDDSFTRDTRHSAGRNAQILDAYVYGNWDVAERPLSARLGRQVFNWGEGVFYRGGVNTSNPVDGARFRLPGSEIKEVLIPVEAVSFNIGLTDNLSMEAFYQFNWKETAIDPVGSYFSETDLFAEGGSTAYSRMPALGSPAFRGNYAGLSALGVGGLQGNSYLDNNGYFKVATIGSDLNAKDDGQFGVAFRYIAEQLNSTEFGFYFVNYHAKEPTVHADLEGFTGLDLDAITNVASSSGFADYASLVNAAGSGSVAAQTLLGLVNGVATVDTANRVNARREYVEDIRMYGFSFNTTLGNASVFGELSYRPNLPIGIAATNDLLGDLLRQAPQLVQGQLVNIGGSNLQLGDEIHNYERVEAYNASLGTIYNFGPSLGFDALTGVAELASEHLRGSDLKYTAYDGSTRYYAGRGDSSYAFGYGRSYQVNKNAYGYTLVLSGTWNDVIAGVNLSPFVVYKDDFEGNSYQTGNFIEGRKAYTLGMRAHYMNSLEAELQYTEFSGGGNNNAVRDRDNIGANVKYSF